MKLSTLDDEKVQRKPSRKRLYIIAGVIFLGIIGLAIGLGVGLSQQNHNETNYSAPVATQQNISVINATSNGIWKPQNGTSWQIQLLSPPDSAESDGVDVWDIDLFDSPASTIVGLRGNGARVICYFSAGTYENWRPDNTSFQATDLGKSLSDWPGERWLDTNSSNVRKIMLTRLDLAVTKNCDGVDPDNVDGYSNDNGLNLTHDDSINYLNFLAEASHARNLSIGLKNAGDIIPAVVDVMQWSVNEQCLEYDECNKFAPFITQGKPVFHLEYPKGSDTNNNNSISQKTKNEICGNQQAAGFSTLIKNMDLDAWFEQC